MELTQEHFDQQLKNLATKDDIRELKLNNEKLQAELAEMVQGGFEDVMERLDVRERVVKLEAEMKELRSALHLS